MDNRDEKKRELQKALLPEVPTAIIDTDLFLDREAVNVPAHGPRKVQLYKTNRKQRRAQQAYNRKHKKDKPL